MPQSLITPPLPVECGAATTSSTTAAGGSMFSRLQMAAANPDWMPLPQHHQTRPRAPEALTVPSVKAPEPIASQAPASKGVGFLSMLYRGARSAAESSVPVAHVAPRPIALPIDAALDGTALRVAFTSNDTWNALPPPTAARRPVAPPSIDAAPMARAMAAPVALDAPVPLWSDLPVVMGSSSSHTAATAATTAPTLDAFRTRAPVPLSTSPIRDATPPTKRTTTADRPLIPAGLYPIGEEPSPLIPSPMAVESSASAVVAARTTSIVEPPTATRSAEAQKMANQQNFLSTVFADGGAESSSAFSALAIATSRAGMAVRAPSPLATTSTTTISSSNNNNSMLHHSVEPHVLDFNSYFSSAFEELDSKAEEADDGMESLRRMVSMVMQTVRQTDSADPMLFSL